MHTSQPALHDSLYRLPWSTNDNPVGWLEITDACNIKCEGCYRLVLGKGHKPMEQIKEEILFLRKWRNCNGISISGGEPVLHPEIREIISFIHGLKMKSIMLTNGYALTDELLKTLKGDGLTGLSFHIDSTQSRPELGNRQLESEFELNDLRLKYASMAKQAGLYAHIGITVTRKNLHEVPDFLQWAMDHMKLINGVSLIIFRGIPVNGDIDYYAGDQRIDVGLDTLGYAVELPDDEIRITSREVYGVIRERIPEYGGSGYLGGTEDHAAMKWLVGNIIVDSRGRPFGHYGRKTMEVVQTFHHLFAGSYLAYPKRRIGRKIFLMFPADRNVRKAFARYLVYLLRNPLRVFNDVNTFGIALIQAPDLLPDGRMDMCDDCPDMCVHEGRLVNSCRLDECLKFGKFLHAHVNGKQKQAEPAS